MPQLEDTDGSPIGFSKIDVGFGPVPGWAVEVRISAWIVCKEGQAGSEQLLAFDADDCDAPPEIPTPKEKTKHRRPKKG